MAKGFFDLSTALEGLWGASWAFCLEERVKVETERVGRWGWVGWGAGAFSASARASVAEGVLVCDEDDVLRVLDEFVVRSEAEREVRSWEPRSVTDEAMLCLLTWRRRWGVVGCWCLVGSSAESWGGGVFNLLGTAASGAAASAELVMGGAGWTWSWGGAVSAGAAWEWERDEAAPCLEAVRCLPLKKEGRREKMPCWCCCVCWWRGRCWWWWSAMVSWRHPASQQGWGLPSDQGRGFTLGPCLNMRPRPG